VFFLSGAAGLLYEICWIRQASLAFGSTIHALSTVLAVFFLGLAAGSALFGGLSTRLRHPLRVYAGLEMGLAVLALLSGPGFALTEHVYGQAYRLAGGAGVGLLAARAALVALVVFPPTLLMGGTLPLFTRLFVRSRAAVAMPVGVLYATNTLGAAAGCAAAGWLLLPGVGVRATVALGAAFNLICAAVAWRLPLEPASAEPDTARVPAPGARTAARAGVPAPEPSAAAVVSVLVFLAGLAALGNEVVWTRFLALVIRNTVLTYTVMLTTVLIGIVLGSLAAARLGDRLRARARAFGALQVASGLAVLAALTLPPAAWQALRGGLVVYGLLLLPAAVLGGATFPLAIRMVVTDHVLAGLGVGRMTAINTVGGVTGSVLAGFVLLPAAGLQGAALTLAGASVAAGCAAWLLLDRAAPRAWRALAVVAALAAWWMVPRATGVRLPDDYLAAGRALVAVREGSQSNLAVIQADGVKRLEIDRLWQGQDIRTQQLVAGHLPMLLHPGPKRVLVVGIGAGQVPAAMTHYDLERMDCVDIEPAVFDLVRAHFDHRWLDDRRARALPEDGRNYVAHTAQTYDVISLELGQPYRPGVGAFYTVEFYRQARARLREGGLVSQFVPLSTLDRESLRRTIASFLEVFPQATLWYNTAELLLVGTNAARFEIPSARLRLLVEDARVRDDLRYSHWGGPELWLNRPPVLLGSFLAGPRGLAGLARGAAPYHDDRPALEYATRHAATDVAQRLEALPLLEQHLEDVASVLGPGLPPESLAAVPGIRRGNLAHLVAGAILRDVSPVMRRRGPRAALAVVDSALAICPGSALGHRLEADLLADQGRTAEALSHYQEAVRLRPDYPPPRRELGLLLAEQGRYAEAAPHLEASLPHYPGDARLLDRLGLARAALGDYRAAVEAFEEALRLDPGWSEATQHLARARAVLGEASPR
jgi:spermidine synthase